MAYFTRIKIGRLRFADPEHVHCDECAEAGAVPFHIDKDGIPCADKPWCWANWKFGEVCQTCGKEL